MPTHPLGSSAEQHLQDLDYLWAHLQPDPLAAQYQEEVQAARDALYAKLCEWRRKAIDAAEAQGALALSDERLDNTIRSLHGAILEDSGYRRRSPKMLLYMPRGLTAIVAAPYLDEVTAARVLADRCAHDPSPLLQRMAGRLIAAADETTAAFLSRQDAVVVESAAYGRLQLAKLDAMATLRKIYHRLIELYPDERERVLSCFRRPYPSRRERRRKRDEGAQLALAVNLPSGSGT